MSVEQLLFIAFFVLVPLLNFLARLLRKRLPAPPTPEAEPEAPAMTVPPPRVLLPVPEPVRPAARGPRAAEVVAVARRRRKPPRVRAADARRGVALMTILGPCRAVEPDEVPR
jgi:hypothetical protein